MGCGVLEANHPVRLRTLLPLDDVELNLIALFQCFIPVQLDG
jgi:hypothetical protein